MPVDDPDQFGAKDLLEIMHDLYPAVEDERSDELPYEHPDLDVVYDVPCAPCKRTGRRPGAFWLPCSECQMLIDLLRPPNAAGSHS